MERKGKKGERGRESRGRDEREGSGGPEQTLKMEENRDARTRLLGEIRGPYYNYFYVYYS